MKSLRESLLKYLLSEAPTREQVDKLASALTKLFGSNCEVGNGMQGRNSYVTITDQNGEYHNFTIGSAAHKKTRNKPTNYRKGADNATDGARILFQAAEQETQPHGEQGRQLAGGSVIMPIIEKIYEMAGEKVGAEDKKFDTNEKSSSMLDKQEEFAKLKREHEQLKRDFDELKSMVLKMMAGESSEAPVGRSLPKIPTPARSAAPRSSGPSLEIDD